MIQYKVFTGTIAEIEAALNAFCAGLPSGVNVNMGPLTPQIPGSVEGADSRQWIKETMYVLPLRNNGTIAVPSMEVPRGRKSA